MNPLSLLTEEQIKTLSDEQLSSFQCLEQQLSSFKSLDDVIIEYNQLLSEFLKTLQFCPHDSDYRLNHTAEKDDRIRSLLEQLLALREFYHLGNKMYIYCKNVYKLDSYSYTTKNTYAGTYYLAFT